jgi:hypothetical protein
MDKDQKTNNDPVELPDADSGDELFSRTARGLNSKVIIVSVLVAVGLFALFALLFFKGKEDVIASIPRFEKAWVLSRLEGENVATDEPKTVLDGRGVMLYFLAYGIDPVTGQGWYFTEHPEVQLPRFVIGGKEIPAEQVKTFEYIDARAVVYWFKYEVSPHFLSDVTKPFSERIYFTDSRKHRMGTRMWAFADVRSDLNQYHYDYVGTAWFVAEADVLSTSVTGKLYTSVTAEGFKPEAPGKVPAGAHRITMLPPFRSGLDRYYRAWFNTLAYQEREGADDAADAAGSFKGGDSRSILIGALRLMGHGVDWNDREFLPKVADQLYEYVAIDDFSYFRPGGDGSRIIPWGEGGVQSGDIVVQGDRYLVLVRNSPDPNEPKGGALTGDDVALDAWNNLVRSSYAHVLEKEERPIEIWRPRPVSEPVQAD